MHPELAAPLELVDAIPIAEWADTSRLRKSQRETRRRLTEAGYIPAPAADVESIPVAIQAAGGLEIPVVTYQAKKHSPNAGTFLHIHGGAFVLGDMYEERLLCEELARAGFLVVSVDYRLAPEHPFPAALDDIYGVLNELPRIAGKAGVQKSKIVVGGLSAGGSLAAALCLRARDAGGPPIALQVLNQPCLDDRIPASWDPGAVPDSEREGRAWMWGSYLGGAEPTYLSTPGRSSNFSRLPSALIIVAELDSLLTEALEYGENLRRAGVHIESEVIQGAYHGFDVTAPLAAPSVRLRHLIVSQSLNASDEGDD
ncbi:alpha/beta hydrolase [Microbacterium sp. X-17]|uniref:alpha/beta hydrolase n=1 Tax=Microbacterium sp. X-17 TaxID=3144404 RepID=UPI0031F4D7B1